MLSKDVTLTALVAHIAGPSYSYCLLAHTAISSHAIDLLAQPVGDEHQASFSLPNP